MVSPTQMMKARIFIFVSLVSLFIGASLAATKEQWRSRTVYQLLTDRFATSTGSSPLCKESDFKYCGGTWRGIISKLDYIAGMGFDAIWISPMTANTPNGYHGYWPLHFFRVNEQFGTEADLKSLVNECHKRGIWVMFDMVANHIGYANPAETTPFNRTEYYNVHCEVSDWNNQQQVENCALAGLPDLNQNHPFVVQQFAQWIQWVTQTFKIDGLRLDAVHHTRKEFWPLILNSNVPIFTIGEALKGDIGYVSQYSYFMDSVLNYPLYFKLMDVFAYGQSFWNLENNFWQSRPAYKDTGLLGNFLDNHDQPRFLNRRNDIEVFKAALTYITFIEGIPIIYYASEQSYAGGNDPFNREALWFSGYNTQSPMYQFLKTIVGIRRRYQVWKYPQEFRWTSANLNVFIRGNITVAVTNGGRGSYFQQIVPNMPYRAGEVVCNLFWPATDCITIVENGKLPIYLNNGETKIYAPKSLLEAPAAEDVVFETSPSTVPISLPLAEETPVGLPPTVQELPPTLPEFPPTSNAEPPASARESPVAAPVYEAAPVFNAVPVDEIAPVDFVAPFEAPASEDAVPVDSSAPATTPQADDEFPPQVAAPVHVFEPVQAPISNEPFSETPVGQPLAVAPFAAPAAAPSAASPQVPPPISRRPTPRTVQVTISGSNTPTQLQVRLVRSLLSIALDVPASRVQVTISP